MPTRGNRFAPLALALAALSSLAGCDGGGAVADAPLYGSSLTGEYTLSDTSGAPVSNTDFAGQYQLVYFGYTYCPNVCPFDVQRMMRGYDLFAQEHPDLAADVQPIFVSVDPERDTPAKVAEYTGAFSDRLLGLTGTPAQLEAASAAFFFTYQKVDPVVEGGDYDIQHPSIGYLVDREGQPMATIPVEQSPEAVAAELEKWVR
ncbi:SCO family protein [Erythrobacter arachoides]|uniref:SCO family protein n=1 Tax=Aurantiacibacter arachoides TaxID=1850444 RepID=A0A845A324_9SPHN|nr:SCO family protein [Aurantiacibacter arachoides]MXO94104.1 SCO family protein [Aurantiacibacter arachoides]GGD66039.1 electron transporter SenC [Aurantiacibacter arachoides]